MKEQYRNFVITLSFMAIIIFIATIVIFSLNQSGTINWKTYIAAIILSFGIYEFTLALIINLWLYIVLKKSSPNKKSLKKIRILTFFTLNRLAIWLFPTI